MSVGQPSSTPSLFTDPEGLGVLCTGNVMDLGLTAGEAAIALRKDFEAQTFGTASADAFLAVVQGEFQKYRTKGNRYVLGRPQAHTHRWHANFMMDAEELLEVLTLESGAAITREATAAVEVFRRRVEDGRKIQAKTPVADDPSWVFPPVEWA